MHSQLKVLLHNCHSLNGWIFDMTGISQGPQTHDQGKGVENRELSIVGLSLK